MPARYHIAVVGSGMAGTFAATLLARAGHRVTLFERAPVLSAVGAGLLLQPSGQAVLRRAGLLEDATGRAEPITHMHAVTHRGRTLVRLRYPDLSPSTYAYGVHRAHLHDTLHRAATAAGVTVRLGHEMVRHSPTATDVSLTDTSRASHGPFDLAVAADGGRSALRQSSGLRHRTHTYTHGAMWCTGPCATIREHLYQVTRGTHVLCGVLPTGHAHASLFWGLPARDFPTIRSRGFQAWREDVLSTCPQAAPLLETHTSFDRVSFTTYHHVHMPRWHTGRLLFLGDAAHATSPHLGQGVNLALLDAEAIATAVATSPDIPTALAAYERARRPHVTFYSQLTYLLSPFFQSDGKLKGYARNTVLPLLPKVPYLRRQMLRTLAGDKPGWLR